MSDQSTIATINGTMLVPGISKNGRLYTKEVIAKAVTRLQERLSDPNGLPVNMRTHHGAGDDSRLIVGRLNSVRLDEATGAAKYSADLYDTEAGRDIAGLTTGKRPALRSVSIHGYWLGPVKRVDHEGQLVETGPDLEVDKVDFTGTPGVTGALIDLGTSETAESLTRTAISESAEATVEAVTEEAPEPAVIERKFTAAQRKQAASAGQSMPDGSYPIKSKGDLRNAIRAVGRGKGNHDAIRRHIVKRAKALGLSNMIPANWKADGSMSEHATRLGAVHEYYPDGPEGQAGFCVDAYNGPISITMRACGIDPADLRAITQAAMTAACDALQAMDPDMDADIDVDGAPAEDTDHDNGKGETVAPDSFDTATETLTRDAVETVPSAAPNGADESTPTTPVRETEIERGSAVAEPTAPAVETAATTETTESAAPARTLTDADLSALGAIFAQAIKENAPQQAPAQETAPEPAETVTAETQAETPKKAGKKALKETAKALRQEMQEALDTQKQQLAEAYDAKLAELRESVVKAGGAQRKGFRAHAIGESDEQPDAAPVADVWANRAEMFLGDFGRTPVPAPGTGSAPAPVPPAA